MAKNVIERILFFIFLSINATVNLNYWKSTNNFEKRINFGRLKFQKSNEISRLYCKICIPINSKFERN